MLTNKQIPELDDDAKLAILNLLDNLMVGAEKAITQSDDPSGIYTEYVLDSEQFRKNIQQEIEKLA